MQSTQSGILVHIVMALYVYGHIIGEVVPLTRWLIISIWFCCLLMFLSSY